MLLLIEEENVFSNAHDYYEKKKKYECFSYK